MADTQEKLLRYKAYLERNSDGEKVLHIFKKIARLPITVQILQNTGIGKVVNSFRKTEGEIGIIAKSIVAGWKTLVSDEAQRLTELEQNNDTCHGDSVHQEENVSEFPPSKRHKADVEDSEKGSIKHTQSVNKHCVSKHGDSSKHRSSSEHRGLQSKSGKESKHGETANKTSESKHNYSNKLNDRHSSYSKLDDGKASDSKHSDRKNGDSKKSDKHGSDSKYKDGKGGDKKSDRKHDDRKSGDSKHRDKNGSDSKCNDGKVGNRKSDSKDIDRKISSSIHKNDKCDSLKLKTDKKCDGEYVTKRTSDTSVEKHSSDMKKDEIKKNYEDKHARHRKYKLDTEKEKIKTESIKSQKKADKADVMWMSLENNDSDDYDNLNTENGSSLEQSDCENNMKKGYIFNSLANSEQKYTNVKIDVDLKRSQSDSKSNRDKVKHSNHKSSSKPHDDKNRKTSSSLSHGHSSKHHKSKLELDDKNSTREKHVHDKDSTASSRHKDSKHSSKSRKRSRNSGNENREKSGLSFADALFTSEATTKKISSSDCDNKKSEQSKRKAESDDYEQLKAKFKVKKKVNMSDNETSKKRSAGTDHEESLPVSNSSKQFTLPDEEFSYMLPETSAHYRPWRFSELSEKKMANEITDPAEMALKSYARTQMYSGKKHTGVTEMFSLFEICLKVLMNNIDNLEYVGGVPFDIMKPVLEKCTVEQLYRLEDYNPNFLEDSDYLWKLHCEKDFRGSEADEMESWREVYIRKYDEREAKLKQLKSNIAVSMAKAIPVRTTKLAYVDSTVKPPRDVRRQQMKYGTASSSVCASSSRARFASAMEIITPSRNHKQSGRPVAPMMQKTMKFMKSLNRR